MTPHQRRRVTMVTSTLAALSLLAPSATAAGAGPDVHAGEARASGLRLTLTAPEELLGALGLEDQLVLDGGVARAALSSTGDAIVEALIVTGTDAVSSTEDGVTDETSVDESFGVVTVRGGALHTELDRTVGRAMASSELGGIVIELGGILDQLPPEIADEITGALDEAQAAVTEIVDGLNGAIGQVEDQVNDLADQSPIDFPELDVDDVPVLDLVDVPLAELGATISTTLVETVGDEITSTATSTFEDISLLGGAVIVPSATFVSTARTTGEAGGADASFEVANIEVQIAGQDVVIDGTSLTVGGVTLSLEDTGLPVDDVLGPVLDALGDLLDAGGLSVLQGTGTSDVAPDGSTASASTAALAVRLRPLQAVDNDLLDLNIELVATGASVAGAPAPVTPAAPDPTLPRTGGGAALAAILALGGAAALTRRKRS